MKEKLQSRKLWVGILTPLATAALVILAKKFQLPLSETELGTLAAAIVVPVVAYLYAQGKVDVEREKWAGMPLPPTLPADEDSPE